MIPSSKLVQMPKREGMKAFMFYIDDWRASWQVQAMDDHEKMAYLNLLMFAASQPDGGLPDNDYELAVASGLELKWWRPTRTKAKRIRVKDEKTGDWAVSERGKEVFLNSGEKIKRCFSFRPDSEQSPDDRLYNARLYSDYVRYKEVKEQRKGAVKKRWRQTEGENGSYGPYYGSDTGDHTGTIRGASHLPPPTSTNEVSTSLQPPPPPNRETERVVVAQKRDDHRENQDKAHVILREHCTKQGLSGPTPQLTNRILAKFPELHMSQIIQYLPRFEGQNSPGLWDSRSRADLEAQSNLQTRPKPAAKSRAKLMMEEIKIG